MNLKKIIIISLAIFLNVNFIFAQKKAEVKQPATIKWISFEEAMALTKQFPKKKIIVDVYTEWCGWCKKMDKETFQDPEVAKYMQKHFYCIKLNAETKDTIVVDTVKFVNKNPKGRGGNNQLAVELLRGKMSYPSLVFLNEQNQVLTVVPGYLNAADFTPVVHYFGEDAYKDEKWEVYQESYKKGKEKK